MAAKLAPALRSIGHSVGLAPAIMRDLFRDTFLGFVRVHLLHHATREAIFGVEMIEELRRHGYAMSPGTLYPILHALEAEGYLRSEAVIVGGKVRRYYRGTSRGARTLERLKLKIRELVDEVLEPDAAAAPTVPARKRVPAVRRAAPRPR